MLERLMETAGPAKLPGLITEEELRQYFLYIKNVKKWSRSVSTIALCGIKVLLRAYDQKRVVHPQLGSFRRVRAVVAFSVGV